MAVSALNAPGKIHLSGNADQAWKTFKQKFDHYVLAAGFKKKPDEEKVALLLNLGGDELLEIYNSFEFPEPVNNESVPATTFNTVMAKFDDHFAPRKTSLIDRYKFHSCQQRSGEPLEAFITRLRVLAKDCNFKTEKDNHLRDQLVFGCRDDDLREKFLREEDLTMEAAEKIAAAHQVSLKQMSLFKDGTQDPLHKVSQKPTMKPKHVKSPSSSISTTEAKTLTPRKFCGTKNLWRREDCPAHGQTYSRCSRKNHIAAKCRAKTRQQKEPAGEVVRPNILGRGHSSFPAETVVNQITVPKDVSIPTNSGDGKPILLKSGHSVMVIKAKKGIYLRLNDGKIVAIRVPPGNVFGLPLNKGWVTIMPTLVNSPKPHMSGVGRGGAGVGLGGGIQGEAKTPQE